MTEKRPGRWELRVDLAPDPVSGKRRRLSRMHQGTKRTAQRALAVLVATADEQRGGTDATLAVLLEEWMRIIDRDRSPRTADGYRRLIDSRIVPTLGHVPLSRLEPRQLDVWYAQLSAEGLAPRTVRNIHAVIRTALGQAMRWGWVQRNVAELATPPSVPTDQHRTVGDDAVFTALDAAAAWDPDFGTMVAVAAATGCRRGELCALRWDDLDLVHGFVWIRRGIVAVAGKGLIEKDTKSHRARRVHIDAVTVAALVEHRARVMERARLCEVDLAADAFVFSPEPHGRVPVPPDRVSHTWQRICRRAGVSGVRLHDLRHWHATYLLGQRVPLEAVSERLGHGLKSTTHDFYAHAVPAHEELAAAELGAAFGRRRQLPA
jgi:integrase